MEVRTALVGARFRPGALEVLRLLPRGTSLLLSREPSNPHDPKAVAVYDGEGNHLGYVPRTESPLVSAAIDKGHEPEARLTSDGRFPNPGLCIFWRD